LLKSIIISGPPAIGKTTIAKGLAKEFGLTHLSGGDILKELAEEEGFDTKGDDGGIHKRESIFLVSAKKILNLINM